jgi:hypothetical protein
VIKNTIVQLLERRRQCFERGKKGFIEYCSQNNISEKISLQEEWEDKSEEDKI